MGYKSTESLTPHEAVEYALERARAVGPDAAETIASVSHALSVSVREGALEEVERAESSDLSVRLIFGKRQAAASAGDLSKETIDELVERVAFMAKASPEDPWCGLADPARFAHERPDLEQLDPSEPSAETLERDALALEAAGLAVAGVTGSIGASASASSGLTIIANTAGFHGERASSSHSMGGSFIAAKDGAMERDYDGWGMRWREDLPSPESIGQSAGERTAARVGSRKLPSGRMAVIFDERTSGSIIGALLGAISGAAVARGTTFLKDKMGERLFAETITLHEDPFLRRGHGSKPFDGEGVAPQPRKLIEDGRLTTWLLNSAAARQLGLETTGHATTGFGGPPGISTTNVWLAPGERSPEELLADMGEGLLVTDMFGPSLNSNTGDWSVGVAGYRIEGGDRAYPVSEITVAGNMLDIFKIIVPANDLIFRSSLTTPAILVPELAVAGV